jgi:hypothetical protein
MTLFSNGGALPPHHEGLCLATLPTLAAQQHARSALSRTLLIGLAITSHNGSKLGSATRDTVALATSSSAASNRKPHPARPPRQAFFRRCGRVE